MSDIDPIVFIAAAALATLLAAVLSAGEVAVVQISKSRAQDLAKDGGERGQAIRSLVDHAAVTAASAAFTRITLELGSTVLITMAISSWMHEWWHVLLVALGACTLIALVMVRISPRNIGRYNPDTVLNRTWRLLRVNSALTGWIVRILPATRLAAEATVLAELREFADQIDDDVVIEEEDREMIKSVFELGTTMTREVMVPRTQMVTVSPDVTARKVMALFLRSGFSRIPVTDRNVDDVVGVVFFKDVARVLHGLTGDDDPEAFRRPVSEMMRSAVFVPESKPVDELLRFMQAERSHIAMVVDEYGGIAGLVTIEDAVEEIVGELTDEHDRDVVYIESVDDGVYRVAARESLEAVGELFDLDIDDDEIDSVGGALAKALGRVPLPGATADIYGLHLVAEAVHGRRKQLATILVSATEAPVEEEDDDD